ncbi:unnamed protein product [Rangifer tarandus platyrhynchus]|uniref:Uncharacterized protein n=1 Tax=Rangifer tarandus platyrhynchus TaxID=3082113 RepID=A0ABN8Y5S8_RANTA|nr:unnamed protein product [Rangifer tarandus platyrhynchus]
MRPGGWRVGSLWAWKDSCSPDPRPPALCSGGASRNASVVVTNTFLPSTSFTPPGPSQVVTHISQMDKLWPGSGKHTCQQAGVRLGQVSEPGVLARWPSPP